MKEGEGVMDDQEDKKLILTVELGDEGLKVNGPINNEMLALYMLEKAKDVVKAHNLQMNQPKIKRTGFIDRTFR